MRAGWPRDRAEAQNDPSTAKHRAPRGGHRRAASDLSIPFGRGWNRLSLSGARVTGGEPEEPEVRQRAPRLESRGARGDTGAGPAAAPRVWLSPCRSSRPPVRVPVAGARGGRARETPLGRAPPAPFQRSGRTPGVAKAGATRRRWRHAFGDAAPCPAPSLRCDAAAPGVARCAGRFGRFSLFGPPLSMSRRCDGDQRRRQVARDLFDAPLAVDPWNPTSVVEAPRSRRVVSRLSEPVHFGSVG